MQIYVKSKDCSTESCTFAQRGGKQQVDLTGNLQAEFLRPVYKKKTQKKRKKKAAVGHGVLTEVILAGICFPCARNRNVINMELLENWSIS